jgi:hypothetical protein
MLHMSIRAHHWTLYFPRQFSTVHTTYALRLFNILLIGICYLCRDFQQNSVSSAQPSVCYMWAVFFTEDVCIFSCHFPSPRLNFFFALYNASECCKA